MASNHTHRAHGLANSRYNQSSPPASPPAAAPSYPSYTASKPPVSPAAFQPPVQAQNPSNYNDTSLDDLGAARYNADVAAIGDRDTSLMTGQPVTVAKGRAPRGLENAVFAWNSMAFTMDDEERNVKEEAKGDLHGGQLHRANRAARGETPVMGGPRGGGGFGGGGSRGGFGGGGERGGGGGGRGRGGRGRGFGAGGAEEGLQAAMAPSFEAPPLAKGFPEELSRELFWNEKIV